MSKSLCKYRRTEIIGQIQEIQQLVDKPRFLCKSCARVANKASSLCKPFELNEESQAGCKTNNSDGVCCPVLTTKKVQTLDKKEKKLNKLIKKQNKLAKKYQKLLKKAQGM